MQIRKDTICEFDKDSMGQKSKTELPVTSIKLLPWNVTIIIAGFMVFLKMEHRICEKLYSAWNIIRTDAVQN